MKYVVTVFVVAAALFAATPAGSAQNYGCISKAQCQQMEALVHQTFGNGYVGGCFIRIMYRESGGNPLAVNWGGPAFGLLQMTTVHRWRGETMAAFEKRMWNPVTHLQAAWRLYKSSGFSPWSGCPG